MSEHEKFKIKSHEELSTKLQDLNISLPVSNDLSIFSEPYKLGEYTLPNRFVSLPMEGVDSDEDLGPSELCFRRYDRFARGGAGLMWGEACAVHPDGRSNPRQLVMNRGNLDKYKRLVEETRKAAKDSCGHDIVFILQLTHSGRYSKPQGFPAPIFAQHNPLLDEPLGLTKEDPIISDEALDSLIDNYIETAKMSEEAGFDGVDMKAVHGYLVAELLGARERPGKYGGSFENRTRFFMDCMKGMQSALTKSFVTTRVTMMEPSPYPYGWGVKAEEGSIEADLSEPMQLIAKCEEIKVPFLGISLGYPRFQPHWNRPHDNSLAGAPPPPEHPLEGVVRMAEVTKSIQQKFPKLPMVACGISWLRTLMPQVAAGMLKEGYAELIGLGRAILSYPNCVNDIINKGTMDPKETCITCSMCSQIMADVVSCTGCVVHDKGIYGPEYKKGRKAAIAQAKAKKVA